MKKPAKPKIKLNLGRKIAVNTPTNENYNELLRILSLKGYAWCGGESLVTPSIKDNWKHYGSQTCIDRDFSVTGAKHISYADKKFFEDQGYSVMSLREFYESQGIDKKQIKALRRWFDNI